VLRQQRKEKLKLRWKQEWNASTRANKIKVIDSSLPSNKFLKLIKDDRLTRADRSWIYQLRTGHIPLNVYLERVKRVDNARCPACSHPKENVQHYLLDCPKYAHERWMLLKHCKMRSPKMKDLLNNTKLIILLANYIHATKRFDQDKKTEGQHGKQEMRP